MKLLKKTIKIIVKLIDDIILVIGVALLSIGFFKIFIPAGYIILGICCIVFAFYIAHNSSGRR